MQCGLPVQAGFELMNAVWEFFVMVDFFDERVESERRRGSKSGGTSSDCVPGCAEHQRLVNVPKSVDLGLGGFEPHLELFLNSLEVAEVAGSWDKKCKQHVAHRWKETKPTPIEQGHFAGLLVRRRESLLEACVTVPELISPSLLRLDALLANGLAAPRTQTD